MKLEAPEGAHLTYCTNVHPGESLTEVEGMLRTFVPDVKRRVSPDAPFGVGLRLAARAATELEAPGALDRTRALLDEAGLYVFTLNGFPYGAFHGTRVKEGVYDPDWLTDERVRYTQALARILAALLPEGMDGSISTVPGCFAPRAHAPGAPRAMARQLAIVAATLIDIERSSGQCLRLALEPEPACFLETTADAVAFFERDVFGREALATLGELTGLDATGAEHALRRHVGVCLDTCHASVEFESPREALATLRRAGIGVPKLQLSAGLRVTSAEPDVLQALQAFDDGVYLHQTVGKNSDGTLTRFLDLDAALAAAASPRQTFSELRVHFHVPIFQAELSPFSSTQDDLRDLLGSTEALPPHLEVETYTFDVLPPRYRSHSVTRDIARELEWVLVRLAQRP